MSDWDNLVESTRGALEALLRKGDEMADRIEEMEAKLKGQDRGPWPNAIRAVNYRISTNEDGTVIQAHRIEQYHEGRWTAIRVFNESEDGTLEEEDQ